MTGIFVQWSDHHNAKQGTAGWIEDGIGCHIWVGARSGSGYGQASHKGRMRLVHRLRYEREVGPIPEGMELDHYRCDRGPEGCCNPHHCRPATTRENTLRGTSKAAENAGKTHCPRGHPLEGVNLLPHEQKRGWRECRECKRERDRGRVQKRGGDSNPVAVNALKTHCPQGHPLTEENLVVGHLAAGKRKCRLCKNAQQRERNRAQKSAA